MCRGGGSRAQGLVRAGVVPTTPRSLEKIPARDESSFGCVVQTRQFMFVFSLRFVGFSRSSVLKFPFKGSWRERVASVPERLTPPWPIFKGFSSPVDDRDLPRASYLASAATKEPSESKAASDIPRKGGYFGGHLEVLIKSRRLRSRWM